MKKIIFIISLLIMSTALISCNETTTQTTNITTPPTSSEITSDETLSVRLFDMDGNLYDIYDHLLYGDVISLPVLEQDNLVFTGWSDESNRYIADYQVSGSRDLYATGEVASDVLTVSEPDPDNNTISISDYTGSATIIALPSHINGHVVTEIETNTIVDSDVTDLYINNSVVTINPGAITDDISLQHIVFYGEPYGPSELQISGAEYNELTSGCEITEGEGTDSWTLDETCPIKEVTHYDSTVLNDVDYRTYTVTPNYMYYQSPIDQTIAYQSFNNLPALTSVELSRSFSFSLAINYNNIFGFANLFNQSPNLKQVLIPKENPYLTEVDGVIFNADETTLLLYPPAKTGQSYDVPEGTINISVFAFNFNQLIQTMHIPESVHMINPKAFSNMQSFQAFIVSENNINFESRDGVLFRPDFRSGMDNLVDLVRYPSAKPNTEYSIPEDVYLLDPCAFMDNQYLEKLSFNTALGIIEDSAFYNTEKLTTLDLPENVDEIFYILEIVIDYDFSVLSTSSIKTIIIHHNEIVGGSFVNLPEDVLIYVPDDLVSDYQSAFPWSEISDQIKPLSEYSPT